MKTLNAHLKRRRVFFITLLILLLPLFASVFGSSPGTAQTPPEEEREVEDRVPKHLPIKVKVKKEKEEKVKDLSNDTPQPRPPAGQARNGFLALAEFDGAASGGNSDGLLDSRDAVYSSLRLWQDSNHDGVSRASELHALAEMDVARIHPD